MSLPTTRCQGVKCLRPLVLLVGAFVLSGTLAGCDGQDAITRNGNGDDPDPVPRTVNLFGDLQDVHDPAIIRTHGVYYLYSTGGGIQWRCSPDVTQWAYQGDLLGGVPQWAEDITDGDLWAPGIAHFNGRYHLYYSASTFGSGRSAIGLATNPVLSPDSANYDWTDRGKVIESFNPDEYNAIDPNIVIDEQDRVWMTFGSWNETGIQLRRLNPETGMLSSEDETLYNIADRPNAVQNAIEAPYIIRQDGYYYLFVSWGECCPEEDENSNYNIRVGRSESVTGPYVDREGTAMTEGGGTLVLEGFENWNGTGHNSVLQTESETLLVYHAYNANQENVSYLRMSPLEWDDGWPFVPTIESN